MTDAWDPSIPEHKELAHQIELGNGIPEMRHLHKARAALKTVGFDILHEEDLADRPDEVPWYYPLEGDISKAQTTWDYFTVWRMSWSGIFVTHNVLRFLEFVGFVPKGTWEVGEALKVAAESLVKGGQTKVCSCSPHLLRNAHRLPSCSLRCTSSSVGNPRPKKHRVRYILLLLYYKCLWGYICDVTALVPHNVIHFFCIDCLFRYQNLKNAR